MSNTKQTAVEWFAEQMITKGRLTPELFEQAKEMEKEQIEDAWYAGDEDGAIHEFEYHYTQVYGGETMTASENTNNTNNNPGNTTPNTYRKKPIEIEAVQFKGFDKESGQVILSERPEWLVSQFGKTVLFFGKPDTLTIKTLEGEHIASIGDWIIKGVKDEFYPCKPDIFEMTYEKV